MATDSYIQAPLDTGNTGKKAHTRVRTIGSDTVHQHVVVAAYGEDVVGVYDAHSGVLVVSPTAQASNVGSMFILNPIGSPNILALRKVKVQNTAPSNSSRRESPRITMETFTFTGTHVGAQITPAKRRWTAPAATGIAAANSSGLTITPVATVRGFFVNPVLSGSGVGMVTDLEWVPLSEEGELLLDPGRGVMFRQADDGASGDDRLYLVDLTWLEYVAPV